MEEGAPLGLMAGAYPVSRCSGRAKRPVPSGTDDVPVPPTVTDRRPVDLTIRRQEYQATPVEPATSIPTDRAGAGLVGGLGGGRADEPAAVVLATADVTDDRRRATVLVRGFDERGATFFTSYESRKAVALEANPQGALLCSWVPLLRQIQLLGPVARVPRAESEAYFASALGAASSGLGVKQSSVLADRAELEALVAEAEARLPARRCPAPSTGAVPAGARVDRALAGPADRLHDRLAPEQRATAADRAPQPVRTVTRCGRPRPGRPRGPG